jgi:phosphatidylserine decarboxylase
VLAPGAARFLLPLTVAAALVGIGGVLVGGTLRIILLGLLIVVVVLLAFLAQFFRDPERVPGPDIVSAADGHVRAVTEENGRCLVSVFMNVNDVHVNRFPLDAEVVEIRSSGSGFRPAYGEGAAHNVQRHYDLSTAVGPVEVVQLTGVVARRLVSLVHPGEHHRKGERLGMILLGSRVDVYLPAARVVPLVTVGQRVYAGRTPIARERS